MNKIRAIVSGALVWSLIFITFGVLAYIPVIKDSLNQQTIIAGILVIPIAIFGASVYYKNSNKGKGLAIGFVMAATALILDAFITVPFIEIPKGGSYWSFYSYPLLWVLVVVNMATVYFYWRFKINQTKPKGLSSS